METFRTMFYMLTPSSKYYERMENVPDYLMIANRFFWVFQLLEFIIAWYRGKTIPRLNDIWSSLTAAIIAHIPKLFFQSFELSAYIWVYQRYNLFPHLSWDSSFFYWTAFLGVDFGYYWLHRMGHEINIFWATHQTHHSSEQLNLSTAHRQGFLQPYFSWMFYLPLALIVPPPVFLIHAQMNLIYQFWIHTEVISTLGPFEFLFNTPSHHRVHHGRNAYCIDKNYGGIFIIWDRLFGTFASERADEVIAYGLVYSFISFDPLKTQLAYFPHIVKQLISLEGWKNKLALIWKGPSWQPGLPRLGNHQYPEIENPIRIYDPKISMKLTIYTVLHFLCILAQYNSILANPKNYSVLALLIYSAVLLFALTTFGAIFDQKEYAVMLERIRLLLMIFLPKVALLQPLLHPQSHFVPQIITVCSFFVTFLFNDRDKAVFKTE